MGVPGSFRHLFHPRDEGSLRSMAANEFGRTHSMVEIRERYGGAFNGLRPPESSSTYYQSLDINGKNNLGGILFVSSSEIVEYFLNVKNICGVSIDPTSGTIVFVGKDKSSILRGDERTLQASDFAAALLITYDDPFSSVAFSLDPSDPQNPDGDTFKKVYWPESYLKYSTVGKAMFEADWFLKVLVNDIGSESSRLNLPDYRSFPSICLESAFSGQSEERHRLWFVCSVISRRVNKSDSSDTCKFWIEESDVELRVRAQKQEISATSSTGLVDSDDSSLSVEMQQFITWCNDNMDTICEKVPSVRRLKQVFVAVEIARYCRRSQVQLDLDSFREVYEQTADQIRAVETFTQPAFRGEYSKNERLLRVHGGVKFESTQQDATEDKELLITKEMPLAESSKLEAIHSRMKQDLLNFQCENPVSSICYCEEDQLVSMTLPLLVGLRDECHFCHKYVQPESQHYKVNDLLLLHKACAKCTVCFQNIEGNILLDDQQQVHCSHKCLEVSHGVKQLQSNIDLLKSAREVLLAHMTEEELTRAILTEVDSIGPDPTMTEDMLTYRINSVACEVVVNFIIATLNELMAHPHQMSSTSTCQGLSSNSKQSSSSAPEINDQDLIEAIEASLQSCKKQASHRSAPQSDKGDVYLSKFSASYPSTHTDDEDIRKAIEASLLSTLSNDEDLLRAIEASLSTTAVTQLPVHLYGAPSLPPRQQSEEEAALTAAIALSLNTQVSSAIPHQGELDLELELAFALSLNEK